MRELETVWNGSTWRQFPTLKAPGFPYRQPQPRSRKDNSRAQVLSLLGESWMSITAVVDRAGICDRSARHWLAKLVSEGLVEVAKVGATKQGGQPQKLYRRRAQARTEAA